MAVFLLLSTTHRAPAMLAWAQRFAQAKEKPLKVWVPTDAGSEPVDEIVAAVEALEGVELLQEQLPKSPGATLHRIEQEKPELIILPKAPAPVEGSKSKELSRYLFDHAHASVMLVRPGESDGKSCDRILVPASGGRHSVLALQLTAPLLQQGTGSLSPFTVETNFGELAEAVGRKTLQRAMSRAGLEESEQLTPKISLGDRFEPALAREAADGNYDLIVIGASNSGRIRNYLFGSIPERLLRGESGMTIAVVRAADPLFLRLRTKIEQTLNLRVPQLTRDDRLDLFDTIQQNSRWNFDFLALITLSTAIAALGLIQNSAAVVIGAMLVAPLMTPLLGSGLGLVQRNLPLAVRSIKAVGFGFLTALLIAYLMGLVAPLSELNDQLLARCEPSLLDLGVAFLSGIAAAYCTARPRLSSALPGVAIAAALVPPIAATGIAFAIHDTAHAIGAATLFGTNVVAIVLGSSVSFYFGGIRGNPKQTTSQRWVTRSLIILLLIMFGLSLPLGSTLLRQFSNEKWQRIALSSNNRMLVNQYFADSWDAELTGMRFLKNRDRVDARLLLERDSGFTQADSREIATYLRQITGKPVEVTLKVTLVTRGDSEHSSAKPQFRAVE